MSGVPKIFDFGKLLESLQPLQNYTNDFQVLSGLDHTKAYANGDGGGDHAWANATSLPEVRQRRLQAGILRSVFQLIKLQRMLSVAGQNLDHWN